MENLRCCFLCRSGCRQTILKFQNLLYYYWLFTKRCPRMQRANQSVAFASSDQDLTTIQLCSIETHAIFSDFRHFQAGSVDFELIVVKYWVWGTFKSDVWYSSRFKGNLCSLLFQNQTLKSVMLCLGQNYSFILNSCSTLHSLTSTANITAPLVTR